ncbi:hypothetical protein M405DRAFT_725689, partial [Rhizopogon salebrosus TDB-379]
LQQQYYPLHSQAVNLICNTSSTFTQCFGRLPLSHVRNQLTAQTPRALLCVGLWSHLGLVKDKDIQSVASLPDVDGKEEEFDDGWDSITLA